MNLQEWGGLTPELVSGWINFDGRNPDWHYDKKNRESMAAKQTEGVAYLWNLLSAQGTALLADEVGMGKTFQALGVASLLWKMNPNARVLVMAPNRDICLHWRREFETFVHVHYRDMDHNVKNTVDGGPVPATQLCFRLDNLARAVERGAGHLYLTTIHALSGLVPRDQKDQGDLPVLAGRAAKELRQRIRKALDGTGFDLVIVDEAHYLRNVGGGSQRVAAARHFFGPAGERLGQHNLLLTATPSHTQLVNVYSILNYFTDVDSLDPNASMTDGEKARALLEKFALRRLRLMEGTEGLYSKRHYRHEKSVPASFEGRPNAEMFFALYQKRLVNDLEKQRENRSLMYGYLEGFESVGRRPEVESSQTTETAGAEDTSAEDFSKARDTDLLRELTADYRARLNHFPEHPKYNTLIEQCVPKTLCDPSTPLESNKHLVFVRRIPSVRELTQRLNAGYDELLGNMILKAWGLTVGDPVAIRWCDQDWSREGFDQVMDQIGSKPAEDEEPILDDSEEEENSYLGSRIAELFVVKKGSGGQTDCANVRLRFVKPESIYSLFLEPARDYLSAGYRYYYSTEESTRADYANSALYERFSTWNSDADLRAATGSRQPPSTPYEHEMPTAWSLIVSRLPQHQRDKLKRWSDSQKPVAENFANYLKAGFLYASPVIVELYCWFVEFRAQQKDRDAHRNYLKFFEWVEPRIENSIMLRYFTAALETFDQMCGKIVDHGLTDWRREWTSLKRLTSPAWFASGENSDGRQRLILGFNSPFYPNVLVSTSVLQEGVNLHLQCHQIHHYGLAGSPGDNEQRVGRLDRLFGCTNKRLKSGGDADLSIFYPYLQRSVDEDQVGSFIERKHRIEEQMDACVQAGFDKEVRLSCTEDWTAFLRRPVSIKDAPINDPYPARFDKLSIENSYEPAPTHAHEEILQWLESHFKIAVDSQVEYFQRVNDSSGSPRTLFLIDPVLDQSGNKRHQPVFVNLAFSPEFSALAPETAYILSLSSPIAKKSDLEKYLSDVSRHPEALEKLVNELNQAYPLVRLSINDAASKSYFYLFTTVDLPLFARHGHLEMLSFHEIDMAFNDLKQFSDKLELVLFNATQDLTPSDLTETTPKSAPIGLPQPSNHRNPISVSDWKFSNGHHGQVAYIEASIQIDPAELISQFSGTSPSENETFLNILRLNQLYPMIRFGRGTGDTHLRLPFPAEDLQDEERFLLERWFTYVRAVYK